MIAASSLTCLWMFGTRGLQSRRGGRKEKSYIGSWVLADPHHRRFPMFLSGSKRRCRKPVKSRLSFTSQVDIKFIIHHLTHIRPRVVSRSSSAAPPVALLGASEFLSRWRIHRGVTVQRRNCTRNSPVSAAS